MDTEWFVLLNCTLSFGVPLAIAVRELVVLRRDRGDGWDRRVPEPPRPAPLPPSGGGEDRRPATPALPDCLIPKPLPAGLVPVLVPAEHAPAAPRRRELEPA